MNNEKKDEVINWLKKFGRIATSRFIGLLNTDYESVKKILSELEKDKIIFKDEETNATYWSLVKDKK